MNKIEKLLAKAIKKDRDKIKSTVALIRSRQWNNLDIKKLSGFDEWRVRVGRYRIKFYLRENSIIIYDIFRRNSHSY